MKRKKRIPHRVLKYSVSMLIVLGYIGAIFVGISLGLIGGGGSILTVPALVYLFDLSAVHATAYSLFIVGLTSFYGSVKFAKAGLIHWKTTVIFAIPSLLSVYLTRLLVVPAIPDPVLNLSNVTISKDAFLLLFFAGVMLLAAVSMIRGRKDDNTDSDLNYRYGLIPIEGAIVGLITGLVGAGGGFLIIPALVLLVGLPMKQAVATSLAIITVKSLFGFIGDLQSLAGQVDWSLLIAFSALSLFGIVLGTMMSKKIPGEKLKKAFGYFVLFFSFFMIYKESLS